LMTVYILLEAVATLRRLDMVEAERDRWQRAADVIRALDLHDGNVVIDLGSGAGYFALKLALAVGSQGKVVAVDIRRLSLSFLWIRKTRRGLQNLRIVGSDKDDPQLLPGSADAVLICNTYHEFDQPERMLGHSFRALRPGGRLVIVDRWPYEPEPGHGVTVEDVAASVVRNGFSIVTKEERFIDNRGDDRWWLLTARRP